MSGNITLPSVEEVQEWKKAGVINFLQENKDKLGLDDDDIDIIKKNKVTGPAFLELTQEELLASPYELPGGPAKVISKLIKTINGEGQGGSQEQESLKRHIERVVKEEVGELRREVKKVRYFAEEWLSSSGIDTETEKGRVVLNGTQMDFPFSLTHTCRRNSHGKFQNPLIFHQTQNQVKLYVVDTHSIPRLSTRKPDFVFIQKGRPLDPLNVVAVGEIRKRTSNNFKNANIGHAVTFGEKVLQLQPQQQYVYAVLTDCIIIRIFRIARGDNNRFSYKYMASESLTYNTIEPPNDGNTITTVTLVRSISAGRTSIVYEGTLENSASSVVVKKAKNAQYLYCFTNEKNVLTRLSELNSSYLLKLLLSNEDTLVMTPLCNKVNNLQIKDIENIIKTLETVHSNFQLVHMDLRKYNFLRDDDSNILIIDWGYSKTQGENAPFAGALECMSDNILQSLINQKQINYEPTIDLICLKRAQDILDFWAVNGKSEWWNKISSDAENSKYDDLFEDIKKLF
ncbi:3690_t:CDS:2 [Gigaspora rosea]|nr:3690_t:CDS:2 [Gigaspora rosea]